MTEDEPHNAAPKPPAAEKRRVGLMLVILGGLARLVMLAPVVATFVAAVALIVYGSIETWHFVEALFGHGAELSRDETLLLAIEIIDLFLLAIVVYVVSLGIYQLFFRPDLHLPKWLRIENLEDLKSKLVSVTVTVLAVYFLGRAVVYEGGPDILYLGGAAALVIAALTWFLSKIDDGH